MRMGLRKGLGKELVLGYSAKGPMMELRGGNQEAIGQGGSVNSARGSGRGLSSVQVLRPEKSLYIWEGLGKGLATFGKGL